MLTLDPIVTVNVNVVSPLLSTSVFDVGLILGTSSVISASDRVASVSSAADLLELGFTTSSAEYLAALKYFGVSPAPASLLVGRVDTGETPVEALTAVLEKTRAFYGVYVCTLTDENALAMAAALDALDRFCLFYGVTGTVTSVTGSSALLASMKATGTRRALGTYLSAANEAAAVMGLAMGLARAHAADSFALCYKTAASLTPVSMTQAEVNSVKALNGNVHVTRGLSRNMLENGAVASGLRYDEVLYLDQIASELQDTCLRVITDRADRLPQSDTATAIFFNAISAVLSPYASRAILSTAIWHGPASGPILTGDTIENGFALWADSYDTQSPADRSAHKAVPIHILLCLTGSVESVILTVNVQE